MAERLVAITQLNLLCDSLRGCVAVAKCFEIEKLQSQHTVAILVLVPAGVATMSINLTRVDFTQLPTCSARGTLKLLPFGGHKRQKIVVGTDQIPYLCC